MQVSVIIVNYNVKYFLEVCLHSVVRALHGIESEIIVVDNNSQDGSLSLIREKFPHVILIENKENTGFAKANNQGVAIARGANILFLNPDTVVPEDFFVKTLAYLSAHPEAGAIGPRLIDGKGQYAPDAKKSFPSLSVAIFKATGINKLFPRSPYFNKYYAVHIGEYETASVEVLSGCCMMVRADVIAKAGGAFDEDYFMYFEDGDLCYRIRRAGYENIYYPETTVIHYKGESTKKTTLSYVKTFNEAFSIFARKHYAKRNARIFLLFINLGVIIRALLSVFRTLLKLLRMPLFDAIVILATLWLVKEFWTEEVKNVPIPIRSVLLTFPAYTIIWLVTMYLNGAYDNPYRALRVIRGMLVGTVLCLAFFGLIPQELRYSRAVIIFSGAAGAIILVALHELLYRLGILRFTPYDALPGRAIIVAEPEAYKETANTLSRVHYAPDIYGRVSPHNDPAALGPLGNLKELLHTAGIDEVIFCVNGLGYKEIMQQMELCGRTFDYKIHRPGSLSFVGSNSSQTAGDLYISDKRYSIAQFAQQRNKRVIDVILSFVLLVCAPILAFIVRQPGRFVANIFSVLTGRYTWVGYSGGPAERSELPPLRPSVLPPYFITDNFNPSPEMMHRMNNVYATHYRPAQDMYFIFRNIKFLGRKPQKHFAGK